MLSNSVRDIVRGNGGKPRHQQLLHGPAEHRKSAAPPRNHARVHRQNSRALSSKPAPRRPRTRQQRPATPDKSPPEDTTRGVKGWGRGRVRHNILTGLRHQKTNKAKSPHRAPIEKIRGRGRSPHRTENETRNRTGYWPPTTSKTTNKNTETKSPHRKIKRED